uniref:PH domain-containing protein n=1 Tax=Guillardia theta TaxID=55529 RepID=A0A7S4PDL9_GUITH|mmetsp:Transcript_48832/g.153359  ORF Transcript_48832/g.153359 Transcript_48832/m.153359 type:complete len:453 (+) Transcript_48832:199-1557(+)
MATVMLINRRAKEESTVGDDEEEMEGDATLFSLESLRELATKDLKRRQWKPTWGKLPPKRDRVLEANLDKQTIDMTWNTRYVVLTAQHVFFAGSSKSDITDMIPLHEITSVQRQELDALFYDNRGLKLHQISSIREMEQEKVPEEERAPRVSERIFEIQTVHDGFNSGRAYTLRASEREECELWIEQIERLRKEEIERQNRINSSFFTLAKVYSKVLYDIPFFQFFVAFLIFCNFIINIINFEILPENGSYAAHIFDAFELFFLIIFTCELLLNMTAHWFKEFITDSWNVFDFTVVMISLISLGIENLPGVSLLRLVRTFRVVRLFKRLQSLRVIIQSLLSAIIPVANAFGVLLLVSSLFSVMAVIIFGDSDKELFGSFSLALFTMFQISTGDGWVTDVVRPMNTGHLSHDFGINFFFISYFLITNIVMLNIVVAVLLDEVRRRSLLLITVC